MLIAYWTSGRLIGQGQLAGESRSLGGLELQVYICKGDAMRTLNVIELNAVAGGGEGSCADRASWGSTGREIGGDALGGALGYAGGTYGGFGGATVGTAAGGFGGRYLGEFGGQQAADAYNYVENLIDFLHGSYEAGYMGGGSAGGGYYQQHHNPCAN